MLPRARRKQSRLAMLINRSVSSGYLITIAALLCWGMLVQACQPTPRSDRTQPQRIKDASPNDQLPHALRSEKLREEYQGLNGGEPCVYDEQCDAPLRCMAQECNFPPAMTGVSDHHTPQVVIHAATEEHAYSLELATDLAEQKRGLMHRRHMDPNFGMLFVYNDSDRRSFWMKNTLIPLDIIFIREDLTIDSIVQNAPPKTLTPRSSEGAAKYVLELVGGECARNNIRQGDRVEFYRLPQNL